MIHASTPDGVPVNEWWRATPRGLEQGFDVPRPSREHPLRVRLEVDGDLAPRLERPDRALLVDGDGVVRIEIGELATIDARGARLPTSFAFREGALEIVVDDRDATYPIVIDPLYTAAEHLLLPATEAANLGMSVAGTRDLAVVGGPFALATASAAQGAVFVFRRVGSTFVEGTALRRPAGVGARIFGSHVACDGTRVVASGSGAIGVVVYVDDLGTLREEAVLRAAPPLELLYVHAIALDGDTIAFGATDRDAAGVTTRAVHVFRRSGSTWSEEARLPGLDEDEFGDALDLDGDTLVIGAPEATISTRERAGRVHVYTRTGSTWSESATISGSSAYFYFGSGVAIEGDVLAIGEPGFDLVIPGSGTASDVGRVHVYRLATGTWTRELLLDHIGGDHDLLGGRLEIEGSTLAIGADGHVLVWEHDGTAWTPGNTVLESAGPLETTQFGFAIDLSGRTLIVGAPYRRWPTRAERGAAFVYDLQDGPQVRARVIAGEGAIVADPPHLHCGPTCAWAYPSGATLTLTAQPTLGWELESWGGACAGATTTCTIVLGTADVQVEATFRRGVGLGEPCRVELDCDSGHCADGVCCDQACGGSSTSDCAACSVAQGAVADGTCTVFGAAVTCRPGLACNPAEHCDGVSIECPADTGVAPAGTICRDAADLCDAVETCDGVSATCPLDRNAPMGTPCRPVAGDCDVAEVCTGASRLCPRDRFRTTAVVCREMARSCDRAERCTGVSASCPIDRDEPDGAFCDDESTCNGVERCVSGACISPGPLECEDDGDPCTAHACVEPTGCETVAIPGCVPPMDAGVADAGVADAGIADAGPLPLDAGSPELDAGAMDRDGSTDAEDASMTDAGIPVDAAAPMDPAPSCACRALGASRSPLPALGFAALVFSLVATRRRRATRSRLPRRLQ